MTELRYDEDATRRLVAIYVTPDVVAQREQFLRALEPQPGERVLDIGCGPGFLASSIAEAVGDSGHVCGIDISEPMIELARDRCSHQSWTELNVADATNLPFPDDSFDAVISTQVLEYVRDVNAALVSMSNQQRSPHSSTHVTTRTPTAIDLST